MGDCINIFAGLLQGKDKGHHKREAAKAKSGQAAEEEAKHHRWVGVGKRCKELTELHRCVNVTPPCPPCAFVLPESDGTGGCALRSQHSLLLPLFYFLARLTELSIFPPYFVLVFLPGNNRVP